VLEGVCDEDCEGFWNNFAISALLIVFEGPDVVGVDDPDVPEPAAAYDVDADDVIVVADGFVDTGDLPFIL
jgi:hypothetical protein